MPAACGESDWKVFRELHSVALERFCERVLNEIKSAMERTTTSAHERYLEIYKIAEKRDKEMADAFNDFRRSTAFMQLAIIYSRQLLTEEELIRFSPETRDGI